MNIKLALKHIQNTSIVAFVLLSFLSPNYTIAQKNERPNIVLILTDQHKADAIGFVGKHPVKTPNLDKLAKSGIRFDNAYVTFPLCTPSRSSMFTGKMPHNLGVNSNKEGDNHLNPGEKEHVIGNVLSHVGYDCAYGGKWHAHEHSMVTGNGFEFIAPMGDIGLAEKSIEYINAKKKTENPFFLVVSFDNPHNICEWARDEPLPYGNIPAVELAKTPQLPVNFKKSKDFPEVLTWEQEANKKVYPTAHYSEADWRQYLYAYYQLVEKVDVEIGKIIDAIDAAGIRQNTLILFTSDHGDGNAAHGWNQKTALFQETTKVPFIVSYPGTIKKSKKANSALISNGIDLYPTICDYADVLVNETLPGESLKSLFEGKLKETKRDFVVVETKFEGKQALGTIGRAVISKKYKYVLYNWGKNKEQLFDLEKDPFEMDNLAKDKRHQKTLDIYRSHLYEWCKKTKDSKFLRKVVLPSNTAISSQDLFTTPW